MHVYAVLGRKCSSHSSTNALPKSSQSSANPLPHQPHKVKQNFLPRQSLAKSCLSHSQAIVKHYLAAPASVLPVDNMTYIQKLSTTLQPNEYTKSYKSQAKYIYFYYSINTFKSQQAEHCLCISGNTQAELSTGQCQHMT